MRNKITSSFALDIPLFDRLKELAKANGMSISKIIENGILKELAILEKRAKYIADIELSQEDWENFIKTK